MDRRDRQSSLPTSLIPHLYAAPRDSSTRTTLTSHSEDSESYSYPGRQLPPVLPANPIYRSLEPSPNLHRSVSPPYTNQSLFYPSSRPTLLPPLASLSADILPRNLTWREGEAGPSSYQSAFHASANSHVPPLPPLQYLEPPLSFDRRDAYSYPQLGSLSISGSSPPIYSRQASTPEPEPNYGSESLSVDIGSNEGDDVHKDKKRRADSMDTDDNNPKKSSRKTAVACNFCRGRKLRCNGAKPSCYNCTVRKFECEYVSTQRRRGPGKAPKGSRSRKGRSEHSGSSSNNIGDRLPTMVPDYELSPDLRPYTSVISLDTFGFQPPDTSPQYPLDRHEPLTRPQYSRTRTSRSRETNLEDRSDAKDIHRNQSGS